MCVCVGWVSWGSEGTRVLQVTHTFLRGHSRREQNSSRKTGVRISTKGAESAGERRRGLFRLSALTASPRNRCGAHSRPWS